MMAPESERANYMQRLPGGMCFAHGRYAGMKCPKWPACATDRQNPDFVREGMREVTNPKEPSATCSEVVERLRDECINGAFYAYLAEKILTEWRERRVQELERDLLYVGGLLWKLRNTAKSALTDAKFESDEYLAKSEWREQIRKGAKHEL